MKKKITALVLVVAILAMLSIGVTLAYFTDTDSAVNVFTVGDVDIELDETVGVTDSNGNPAPDRVTQTETGATYTGIMPGNTLDKKVTVTNLENPAYVRVVVIVNNHLEIWKALDCEPGTEVDMSWEKKDANYTEVFTNWGITFENTGYCGGVIPEDHLNGQGGVKVYGIDTAIAMPGDYYLFDSDNYFTNTVEQNASTPEMVQSHEGGHAAGVYAPHLNNYERVYVYYMAMDKGESITLFDGLYCPTWFNQEQAEMFDGLEIEIYAAAIQQEGFVDADGNADPKAAFEQLDSEFSISDMRGYVYTDAAGLADALANAEDGATIKLTEDVASMTISSELNDVTIDAQGNNVQEVIVTPEAALTNVTLTDLDTTTVIDSGSYRGVVQIQNGAEVNNLVIENSTFNVTGGRSAIVGCTNFEPTAEVTITNCKVTGPKYVVYTNAPGAKVTVENCEISNIASWVVQMNGADTVGTQVTITGNTFTNCNGGMAKWLGGGAVLDGGHVTFTNNTLKSCTGHDGKDTKWFEIKPTASQLTVSGNTLDGAAWIPGTAQGLGQ